MPVSVSCGGSDAQLKVGDAPAGSELRSGEVWLALYSNSVTVDIGRGENPGREITYTNVVRQLIPAGSWDGREARYSVKIPQGIDSTAARRCCRPISNHAMLGADVVTVAAR